MITLLLIANTLVFQEESQKPSVPAPNLDLHALQMTNFDKSKHEAKKYGRNDKAIF
jgi:hypothetical protein